MARQIVILALVLFAVVGYASAADKAPSGGSNDSAAAAPVSGNDDSIGNTDDDASAPSGNGGNDEVVAGPVGSETGGLGPSGETPASGVAALKVSAAAGVAGFFFF